MVDGNEETIAIPQQHIGIELDNSLPDLGCIINGYSQAVSKD